jgi:hypothetical protein
MLEAQDTMPNTTKKKKKKVKKRKIMALLSLFRGQ